MTMQFLVPMLAMITLGLGIAAAWTGARRTERMRKDDRVPPSALAQDGDPRRAQTDDMVKV